MVRTHVRKLGEAGLTHKELVAWVAALIVSDAVLVALAVRVLNEPVLERRVVHHGALRLEALQRELEVVIEEAARARAHGLDAAAVLG